MPNIVNSRGVYLPHVHKSGFILNKSRIQGTGGTLLLQKGGPGVGSSYSGYDDYKATTGGSLSLGKSTFGLGQKLDALTLKPKPVKIKNIKFQI